MQITTELFFVPYEDKFIVYAPLKKITLLVNKSAADIISGFQEKGVEETESNKELISTLKEKGIIGSSKGIFSPKKTDFKPTNVTLFPTFNCNLRCLYCYSEGGKSKKNLDFEIAKSSTDLIINNALAEKEKRIQVTFHGGGEPFVNFDLMKETVDYTITTLKKKKLDVDFFAQTNGCLTDEQLDWSAKYLKRITVSIDGPEDIQNKQRPLVDGGKSFEKVLASINHFDKKNFRYGARITVTKDSVTRMDEMLYFFKENTSLRQLHLEPLYFCGRCQYSEIQSPDQEIFVGEFLKTKQLAEKLGIELNFLGQRINKSSLSFCGAVGKNFVITPEGYITSCYEVSSLEDPRSEVFFYGSYDENKKKIKIDTKKLSVLASRTTNNLPYCNDCFIKYDCAGDCLAKVANEGDLFNPNGLRCYMNKALSKESLIDLIK